MWALESDAIESHAEMSLNLFAPLLLSGNNSNDTFLRGVHIETRLIMHPSAGSAWALVACYCSFLGSLTVRACSGSLGQVAEQM